MNKSLRKKKDKVKYNIPKGMIYYNGRYVTEKWLRRNDDLQVAEGMLKHLGVIK